jgi:hypothetical protein
LISLKTIFFSPKNIIFKNYGSGSRTWSGFGYIELEPDLVVLNLVPKIKPSSGSVFTSVGWLPGLTGTKTVGSNWSNRVIAQH